MEEARVTRALENTGSDRSVNLNGRRDFASFVSFVVAPAGEKQTMRRIEFP